MPSPSRTKSQSFRAYVTVAMGLSIGIYAVAWLIGHQPSLMDTIVIAMAANFVAGTVMDCAP